MSAVKMAYITEISLGTLFPSHNVHSVKNYASPLRIGTDISVSTAFASKSNNVNEFCGLV